MSPRLAIQDGDALVVWSQADGTHQWVNARTFDIPLYYAAACRMG